MRTALGAGDLTLAEQPVRLRGGFDTDIFVFRLGGAPPALAGRLVLRRLGPLHDPRRVLRERAAHEAAVAVGYPAPRVFIAETDPRPVGGPCLVMEWLPGRSLPEARTLGIGAVLGDLQARLHDCDPAVYAGALERQGVAPRVATLASHLEQLEARAARTRTRGLDAALAWIARNAPSAASSPVICHGDFHPLNVLMDATGVTGVLDWPHAIIGDPMFDVATTRAILSLASVTVARPLGRLLPIVRPLLLGRHLAAYERRRRIDRTVLRYYEAMACLKALIFTAESHALARETGQLRPTPWDTATLTRYFEARTGIAPDLSTGG